MTLPDYSDALLPEGREVFGVRLLPLCIGHALLLHRVRSPLVTSGQHSALSTQQADRCPLTADRSSLPGLGDLLLALEICRLPGVQLPSRARLKWLGVRQLRFTRAQKLRLEGRYLDGVRDFRAHWQDAFTRLPGLWHDDKEAVDCGVPGLVGLKLGLMARLGVSEAQALAAPIARAVYDLCALSATEGRLQLFTEAEEELMAAARARGSQKPEVRSQKSAASGQQSAVSGQPGVPFSPLSAGGEGRGEVVPPPAPAELLAAAAKLRVGRPEGQPNSAAPAQFSTLNSQLPPPSPQTEPAPVSIAPMPHGLRPAPEQPAPEQAQRPGDRADGQQRQPEGQGHRAGQTDEDKLLHTRNLA